jgi:hypothetical protein
MATPPFDPTSAHFLADPYRAYAALRGAKGGGLVRVGAPYEAWWVTSHTLVTQVCGQPEVFVKPGGRRDPPARPFGITAGLDDGLFFLDGDDHARVRAAMEDVFTQAIEGAEARAQAVAEALVAAALAAGRCDLVADYAAKLAATVGLALLGIPAPEEGPKHAAERLIVDGWLRTMLARHDKTLHPLLRAEGATAGMALRSYLQLRAAELRDVAGDTSILAGIARRVAPRGRKPGAGKMSPDEALNTAAHFALGGYLSTEFLIGSGVLNLLRHPAQWALLQREPERLGAAVEEMLRFDAPFQLADRWVDHDTPLGGTTIPARSRVVVVYGAANRDPDAFADPDRFDIQRRDAAGHYGFGHGVHRCIGAPLARIVAGVAVRTLLQRAPWVRLGEVGPWGSDPYFRALTRAELLFR